MSSLMKNLIRDSRILVVDDEPANLRLLEKLLRKKGYSNVSSTLKSLDVAALHKINNFDLILLDLEMPLFDGFSVMKQLHNLSSNSTPAILVLTAQHMQSQRQKALDNGARDYVTKPFNADELISRVRNILEVQMAYKYMHCQNEILEEEVKLRTQSINDSRLQVVRYLGRAAEYRDNETGLHVIRMSKMAAALGKAVKMSNYQCDILLNASAMHDIGKIGIPDNILLKPGKHESHEWEIMKKHAQIGADILSGDQSDLMIMAHDIALTHHEKWNGEGYPHGLKAEEIPLAGRVTAIADVFDALTSQRPYKEAWSVESSVDFIKNQSGKHFDPNLVSLFLEVIPQFVEIKNKYAEPVNNK